MYSPSVSCGAQSVEIGVTSGLAGAGRSGKTAMGGVADPRGVSSVPLAALAPLVCAAHCLSTPLLLVLLPSIAVSPMIETGLVLIAFAVGVITLSGGVRVHGSIRTLVPFGFGSVIWAIALLVPGAPVPEPVMMATAGVLAAGSIIWDARLRGRVSCPATPSL